MSGKSWDRDDLRKAGARDVLHPVDLPGLTSSEELLKLFQPNNWQVTTEEYVLLLPSMRLASHLLRVALPYISNFLPSHRLFSDGKLYDEFNERIEYCPKRIPILNLNPSIEEVTCAFEELQDMANSVKWQLNNEMWDTYKWLGITRLVDQPRPWDPISLEMLLDLDDVLIKDRAKRRPLIIGIAGEYLDAIRQAPKPSEQFLRATFQAGVTMAHEIGHAIFHQDFKSYNPPFLDEPPVGNDRSGELGHALIAWIFSGFHPEQDTPDSLSTLYWSEWQTTALKERPFYRSFYSIPIKYLQEKLSQVFWDEIDNSDLLSFSRAAKLKLKPTIELNGPNANAVASNPEWRINTWTGMPQWKTQGRNFKFEGYMPFDPISGLTEEEIQAERVKAGLGDAPHPDAKEVRRIEQRLREFSGHGNTKDDDDTESFDFHMDPEFNIHHNFNNAFACLDNELLPTLEYDRGIPVHGSSTTSIVVKYFPEIIPSNKQDSSEISPNREEILKSKRLNEYITGDEGKSDEANVDSTIYRNSPFCIARGMTRLQLHKRCEELRLAGYSDSWLGRRESAVERFQKPMQEDSHTFSSKEDKYVVMRLYNQFLKRLEEEIFADDQEAVLKVKQARKATIPHWSLADLQDFSRTVTGDLVSLIAQIKQDMNLVILNKKRSISDNSERSASCDTCVKTGRPCTLGWRQLTCGTCNANKQDCTFKQDSGARRRKAACQIANYYTFEAYNESPSHPSRHHYPEYPFEWQTDELKEFCSQHNIKATDTRLGYIYRAKKLLIQNALGKVATRFPKWDIIGLTGAEGYAVEASLEHSSVAALKSRLFYEGDFPPGAKITLRFSGLDPARYEALEDDKTLDHYKNWPVDWQNLEMKVEMNSQPDLSAGEAVLGGRTIDRTVQLALQLPRFSVGDTVNQIDDRALQLDRLVLSGGNLPGAELRPQQRSISGKEILENVEDYEEREEAKGQSKNRISGSSFIKDESVQDKIFGFLSSSPGISPMREICNSVPNKRRFSGGAQDSGPEARRRKL